MAENFDQKSIDKPTQQTNASENIQENIIDQTNKKAYSPLNLETKSVLKNSFFLVFLVTLMLLITALVGILFRSSFSRTTIESKKEVDSAVTDPFLSSVITSHENDNLKEIGEIDSWFQELLDKNCVERSPSPSEFIQMTLVPISFDRSIHDPQSGTEGEWQVACYEESIDTKGDKAISFAIDPRFFIYDQYSPAPGVGGPPLIGAFGEEIKTEDNLQIFAYLQRSHSASASVDETGLVVRVIKTFQMTNGEKIHVSASKIVLDPGSTNLVSILNQYIQPFEDTSNSDRLVTKEVFDLEPEIITQVMNQTPLLDNPEVKDLISKFQMLQLESN